MKSFTSKILNILLEWNGDFLFYFIFSNLQIKLHFCSDDVIFFGSLYLKCFGSFCRSPAIGIADCCMESICCNTEIPAVTVCPERDYRIFLNWSSIHLSIKIRSKRQERNSSIKCTWGIYNTQQDCYNQPLKRAYFWNFIIPVVPCFYISHCIGFCWHPRRGNREGRGTAQRASTGAAPVWPLAAARHQHRPCLASCGPGPPHPFTAPPSSGKEPLRKYKRTSVTSDTNYRCQQKEPKRLPTCRQLLHTTQAGRSPCWLHCQVH